MTEPTNAPERQPTRWYQRKTVWGVAGLAACGAATLGSCWICPGKLRALAHQLGQQPSELRVQRISLTGPLAEPEAEISGLAWHGEELVLLPQFPKRAGGGQARVYKLSRDAIRTYLDSDDPAALQPTPVTWNDPVSGSIPGFDGFEAIAFKGEHAFVAVESDGEPGTVGYLLRGDVDTALKQVTLSHEHMARLPAQDHVGNLAYEALAVTDNSIYVLYEVNGATNAAARVFVFDHDLNPKPTSTVSHLEYRITDATSVEGNRFWVTNVFWPGASWKPGHCTLAERFGVGATHRTSRAVERLVELEITPRGLEAVDAAPIQFRLEANQTRNWEGLARFEGGFIIATDEHPESVLAFVHAD